MKRLKTKSSLGKKSSGNYKPCEISAGDIKKIKKLADNPEIFNLITNSIIPFVNGHYDIKEAIVLQLFGGVTRKIDDGISIPGGINILIVGDPGIGKTHLLKGASNLAKKRIYIDSNKSYVNNIHHHFSDDIILQNIDSAVLSQDDYLVCLDALKLESDEVMFLKEALCKNTNFNTEEEIFNILNSKCSVLAAMNPKFGRFDVYKSLTEQINIHSTIISCFDLIFLVEDRNNVEEDYQMAYHLLKLHQENKIKVEVEEDIIIKYIQYARENISPKLTDEAIKMIQKFYIRIRQSFDDDLPILITPRQLESLVKLSEAHAKIRLSDHVTISDVKRVIGLYGGSLKQVGYNVDQKLLFEEFNLSEPKNLKNSQRDLNFFR